MQPQVVLNGTSNGASREPHKGHSAPTIDTGDFHWNAVDDKFHRLAAIAGHEEATRVLAATPSAAALITPPASPPPPLGPLVSFVGTFSGNGLNTIWRPNNATTPPGFPNDALLELNLTQETLSFGSPLGTVPNRGSGTQKDIFLNGVPYTQSVNDITNTATGKADPNSATAIHFEPGVWMAVPSSTDPSEQATLCRMGSIPHGTTINAQGLAPASSASGAPTIPAANITPFPIGGDQASQGIKFPQQDITNESTSRLPQNLTLFNTNQSITAQILADPNQVLRNANTGQTITKNTTFTVSTTPQKVSPIAGGGTANINFLSSANGENANAVSMIAQFWIETVQYHITVQPFTSGSTVQTITPSAPNPTAPMPTFQVHPGSTHITSPTTISVTATQIQYSQTVNLNFNGLSWPHVSCATLVPASPIPVVLASG